MINVDYFSHLLRDGAMKFTNKTEYAIRTVLNLGSKDGRTATIHQISEEESIPKQFLAHIVRNLRKAGIVKSIRGVNGGIKLSANPDNIYVLDIIIAIEGPLAIYNCMNEDFSCERKSTCPLCGVWARTQKQIINTLASFNIAELLDNNKVETGRV